MATPTYTLISEQVLSSPASSVSFTSIPGTYKDLVLEVYGKMTSSNYQPCLRFNSDSGTNYSGTYVRGDGSSASSGRGSNQTYVYPTPGVGIGTNSNMTWFLHLLSYASTSIYKPVLGRLNTESVAAGHEHTWRSTSAISTILVAAETGNFDTGSTFRLWGVA